MAIDVHQHGCGPARRALPGTASSATIATLPDPSRPLEKRSRTPDGSSAPARSSKVGVLGCGLMGHGIAQICAQADWDVVVRELDQEKLDKGMAKIEKQLAKAVDKGKLEQADADAIRGRITPTLDYGDLADCDLVIEAITEDLDGKLEMWGEVDGIVKDDAYFATNTSSLSVADAGRSDQAPRALPGPALLQPRPGDAAARGRAGRGLGRRRRRPRLRPRREARQDDRRRRRQPRLHRQPAAGALHARRDPRPRAGRRLDRGHRHGDDGRRQPPDGPADPRGLRRARHAGGDLRGDGRRLRRGALRGARDAARRWSLQAILAASPARGSTITRARSRSRSIRGPRQPTSATATRRENGRRPDQPRPDQERDLPQLAPRLRQAGGREVPRPARRLAGDRRRATSRARTRSSASSSGSGERTGAILAQAEESAQQIRGEAESLPARRSTRATPRPTSRARRPRPTRRRPTPRPTPTPSRPAPRPTRTRPTFAPRPRPTRATRSPTPRPRPAASSRRARSGARTSRR